MVIRSARSLKFEKCFDNARCLKTNKLKNKVDEFCYVNQKSKKAQIGLVLTAIVVTSLFAFSLTYYYQEQNSWNKISSVSLNAKKYLINSYNPSLKLIPETSDNITYWITSDNLLAYFALRNYDPEISNSIKESIATYANSFRLPTDLNNLPIDYKHEAVIGGILTQPFRNSSYCILQNNFGVNLKAELNNDTVMPDWQDYADWVAYQGLSSYNHGDKIEAAKNYQLMMKMWDGNGFKDKAFDPEARLYDTYKIALALILAGDCGIQINEKMIEIIISMQDSNGGIHTKYNSNLTIVGSINTETTSLIAIIDCGRA